MRLKALLASLLSAVAATLFAVAPSSIDVASYKPSAAPSAVLVSFADGPATRGFAWQTDSTVTESKVWLLKGRFTAADDARFERDGQLLVGTCAAASTAGFNCHKVATGSLDVGATYSYRLGGGGKYVYGSFAVKPVNAGDELVFLNLNDAQTKEMEKLGVWENTCRQAAALLGDLSAVDAVLYGGDLSDNSGNKLTSHGRWGIAVDSARLSLGALPWSLGFGWRHDGGGSYPPVYADGVVQTYASGQPVGCFSYDYGRAHIAWMACTDQSFTGGEAMAAWLDEDLQRARTSGCCDWLVVMLHWGPYTTADHAVSDAGSLKNVETMTPILSRNHVDLVLQAHDHAYSKTHPYRWDAAGYTTTAHDTAVVNFSPKAETIGGEVYDVDPEGTYYVSCGAAGERCDENREYANIDENDKYNAAHPTAQHLCYATRHYRNEIATLNVDSPYGRKGGPASDVPMVPLFGVLKIKGETLAYDVYAVDPEGNSAAVLYDTLRVKKTLKRAKTFSVTPYVQHPATNAMSLIWFTKEEGVAKVTWQKEDRREGAAETFPARLAPQIAGEAITAGVWAEALTNNVYAGEGTSTTFLYRHRIRLTGLETGTRYRYTVELDNGVSYSNTFRTAPGKDSSVRFIYYNDSETEPGNKCTTDWTDPATGNNRTYYITKNTGYASNIVHMVKREPDLFVIAGDLAAKGGLQKNWDEFWKHNAGGNGIGYNDPAGSIPIMAAIGNHDLQDAEKEPAQHPKLPTSCENWGGGESALERYLSYFEYEPNGVKYEIGDGETFAGNDRDRSQMFHRLDYGPVTLIFLDTNNGDDSVYERDTNTGLFRDPDNRYGMPAGRSPDFNPGSKQYAWLTNNLADAQAKSKFTFVVNHHCPYSVGYHNRTNVTEGGEWLSARAVRILGEAMIRYGVDGWLCGHDEMVEHSQISGMETLPDGTTRPKTVDIFDMGTAGDGLRGQQMTAEDNPKEVWRAHRDAPEVWNNGVLVDGGKHYGHMEVNVEQATDGRWKCTLTPVYIFVNSATGPFERRVYDDVVTLYADGTAPEPPEPPTPSDGWERDAQGNCLVKGEDDLVRLRQWVADGSNTVGMTFLQTADIALSGVWTGIGAANNKDNVGTEAVFRAKAFQGTYDGGNHTVSDIVLGRDDYTGFFGSAYGATIRNLKLQVADNGNGGFATEGGAKATEYSGALAVGVSVKTTIVNVETLAGTFTTKKAAAGLVGYAAGGTVLSNCVNNLTLMSENNEKAAGLIACAQNTGGYTPAAITICDCTNNGNVTAKAGTARASGLVSYTDCKVVFGGENVVAKNVTISPAVVSVISLASGTVELADDVSFQVPAGYRTIDKNAVDGLCFATVANGVATLVRENAMTLGNAYKVMSSVASGAFHFAKPGTISFDVSLRPDFRPVVTAADGLEVSTSQTGAILTVTASRESKGLVIHLAGNFNNHNN